MQEPAIVRLLIAVPPEYSYTALQLNEPPDEDTGVDLPMATKAMPPE